RRDRGGWFLGNAERTRARHAPWQRTGRDARRVARGGRDQPPGAGCAGGGERGGSCRSGAWLTGLFAVQAGWALQRGVCTPGGGDVRYTVDEAPAQGGTRGRGRVGEPARGHGLGRRRREVDSVKGPVGGQEREGGCSNGEQAHPGTGR